MKGDKVSKIQVSDFSDFDEHLLKKVLLKNTLFIDEDSANKHLDTHQTCKRARQIYLKSPKFQKGLVKDKHQEEVTMEIQNIQNKRFFSLTQVQDKVQKQIKPFQANMESQKTNRTTVQKRIQSHQRHQDRPNSVLGYSSIGTWNSKYKQRPQTSSIGIQQGNISGSQDSKRKYYQSSQSKSRCRTPLQDAVFSQIQVQCQRIDPTFQLKEYMSSEFPEAVRERQQKLMSLGRNRQRYDQEMLQKLKFERSFVRTLTPKFYGPHNKLIKKLQRIYNQREPGETEQTTLENNQQQPILDLDRLASVFQDTRPRQERTTSMIQQQKQDELISERRKRWSQLKRSVGIKLQDQQDALIGLFNQNRIHRNNKADQINQLQKEQEELKSKIKELKLKNSPMINILQQFEQLVDHYYIDFSVPMKQIVDFYGATKEMMDSQDDVLLTYQSIDQKSHFQNQEEKLKFAQKSTQSQNDSLVKQVKKTPRNSKKVNIKKQLRNEFHNGLISKILELDDQVKIFIKQAQQHQEQSKNFFGEVTESYRRNIMSKNLDKYGAIK